MKSVILALLATAGSASIVYAQDSQAPAKDKEVRISLVEVISKPPGARVTLFDIYETTYQRGCIAPCKIEVDTMRYLGIHGQKEGYETTIVRQPSLPGIGPLMSYSVQLYTAEEKAANRVLAEENKRKKIERDAWVEQVYLNPDLLPVVPECEGVIEDIPAGVPTKRYRAPMPQRPKTSAQCTIRFNITTDGVPTQLDVLECNNGIFEVQSSKNILGSRYTPREINGVKQPYCGVFQKSSYTIR